MAPLKALALSSAALLLARAADGLVLQSAIPGALALARWDRVGGQRNRDQRPRRVRQLRASIEEGGGAAKKMASLAAAAALAAAVAGASPLGGLPAPAWAESDPGDSAALYTSAGRVLWRALLSLPAAVALGRRALS